MSTIPELRASLVRAAERDHGHVTIGATRSRPPRRARTRLGAVATAAACAVALAVAVVALTVAPGGRPAASDGSGVVSEATLRAAAERTLRTLMLPPGAVTIAALPSMPFVGPGSLSAAGGVPLRDVHVSHVWRVRRNVADTLAFITAHRPAGSMPSARSSAGTAARGRPIAISESSVTLSFRPTAGQPVWRILTINVVTLHAGASAVRADAYAGPVPSSWGSRIPRGVSRVEVLTVARTANHGQRQSTTVVPQTQVKRLVALFTKLPSAPPTSLDRCRRTGTRVQFRFYVAGNRRPAVQGGYVPDCHLAVLLPTAGIPVDPGFFTYLRPSTTQGRALLAFAAGSATATPHP